MGGDLADALAGEDLGILPRLLDRLRIVGPAGNTGAYPAALKASAHRSQLDASSQRPWMKTTGVLPLAFAASISRSPAR